MKIRMKTWQLALVAMLSVAIPILAVSQSLKTTDPEACKGHHASKKDFYREVRMLPPSTVMSLEGNRLNYATVEQGIELGSLELEPGYSIVPVDFEKNHTGCYGIVYCEKHLTVLQIDVLDPKQCGTLKQ